MDEIRDVLAKYDEAYVRNLTSAEEVTKFAGVFYKDAAEIFDTVTRLKNVERNPTGFGLDDAPVLGLLVRIWKLLKEIVRYYEEDNAEIAGILERPALEATITARYLMGQNEEVIADYRKCSYKDRLRILRDLKDGSPFFDTKAGQRLVASVEEKLALEGLGEADFAIQKKNRWRLQGKTFYQIFAEVADEKFYAMSYGMMSDSLHGSWNDSLDFCLIRHDDGTYGPYPFFQPADIRFVSPLIRFCKPAYEQWLRRIEAEEEYVCRALEWIDKMNAAVVDAFDRHFGLF